MKSRSERERIALTGLYTGSPPSSVGTPRALITTEKTLPVPKLDLESVQLEEDDLQLDEINIRYRSNNSEGEKSSPEQKHKVDLRNIPFCAGRSTQPSHNVGLNIQGIIYKPIFTNTITIALIYVDQYFYSSPVFKIDF